MINDLTLEAKEWRPVYERRRSAGEGDGENVPSSFLALRHPTAASSSGGFSRSSSSSSRPSSPPRWHSKNIKAAAGIIASPLAAGQNNPPPSTRKSSILRGLRKAGPSGPAWDNSSVLAATASSSSSPSSKGGMPIELPNPYARSEQAAAAYGQLFPSAAPAAGGLSPPYSNSPVSSPLPPPRFRADVELSLQTIITGLGALGLVVFIWRFVQWHREFSSPEKDKFLHKWRHPHFRLAVAGMRLLSLTASIATDPALISWRLADFGVFGQVVRLLFFGYTSRGTVLGLFQVLYVFTAVISCGLIGVKLFHHALLRDACNLEMFAGNGGETFVAAAVFLPLMVPWVWIWSRVLVSWGYPPAESWLPVTYHDFNHLVAVLSGVSAFASTLMVVDSLLQDTSKYQTWVPAHARNWWAKRRQFVTVPLQLGFSALWAWVVLKDLLITEVGVGDEALRASATELSRSFVVGLSGSMDVFAVTQDWEFPSFENPMQIKLLFFDVASIRWSPFRYFKEKARRRASRIVDSSAAKKFRREEKSSRSNAPRVSITGISGDTAPLLPPPPPSSSPQKQRRLSAPGNNNILVAVGKMKGFSGVSSERGLAVHAAGSAAGPRRVSVGEIGEVAPRPRMQRTRFSVVLPNGQIEDLEQTLRNSVGPPTMKPPKVVRRGVRKVLISSRSNSVASASVASASASVHFRRRSASVESTPGEILGYDEIQIAGKWFNYTALVVGLFLTVMRLWQIVFYLPEKYGQYLHPSTGAICAVTDTVGASREPLIPGPNDVCLVTQYAGYSYFFCFVIATAPFVCALAVFFEALRKYARHPDEVKRRARLRARQNFQKVHRVVRFIRLARSAVESRRRSHHEKQLRLLTENNNANGSSGANASNNNANCTNNSPGRLSFNSCRSGSDGAPASVAASPRLAPGQQLLAARESPNQSSCGTMQSCYEEEEYEQQLSSQQQLQQVAPLSGSRPGNFM